MKTRGEVLRPRGQGRVSYRRGADRRVEHRAVRPLSGEEKRLNRPSAPAVKPFAGRRGRRHQPRAAPRRVTIARGLVRPSPFLPLLTLTGDKGEYMLMSGVNETGSAQSNEMAITIGRLF